MLFGKVHNLLQHHFFGSLKVRNLSAISWRRTKVSGDSLSIRSFVSLFTRFLIRMNNYLPSITFWLCLKLDSPSLLFIQPFFPFLLSFAFSFNSTEMYNQSLSGKWTYTFQAVLEGLSHWMLNLQPIMWKIFLIKTQNRAASERKIINLKTFKTMKDLWRMDNERGYWIRGKRALWIVILFGHSYNAVRKSSEP